MNEFKRTHFKFEKGLWVHNIFNREWLRVDKILDDGSVEFVAPGRWCRMSKNEVKQMLKASCLNEGIEYDK